jgi:hypothetical protein
MPPIIRLIQAIQSLTKSGAIKTVEDAFRLAKRELGERFDEYKEIVKDAFNDGKRKLTIDKRTKNIKKDEEAGIKSLDVEDSGEGFIDFVRKQGDEEGANKLQKIENEIKEAINKADIKVSSEQVGSLDEFHADFVKETGINIPKENLKQAYDVKKSYPFNTPIVDKNGKFIGQEATQKLYPDSKKFKVQDSDELTKGIKSIKVDELSDDDPMGDLERILKGETPRESTDKEMTERALAEITKKKSLGTMSQEAMIRSALREFLSRRLKDGTLTIPDAGDRDAIERFTQGADPIDVFRKAYGEDAIKGVSEIQDEFGDQLQGAGSFNELGDMFEKLFYRESQGGLMYNTTPKPVDQYGFDPGLMSLEEVEGMLRKDLKEKQMLEDFDVTDRKPNAAGGLAGILKL